MTARRQAKSRNLSSTVTASGGVPRSLLLGRCIEVWSGTGIFDLGPAQSAFRRWSVARHWWLDTAGIESTAEGCALIPVGGLWSVEYLNDEWQDMRLARAGATAADIDDLRAEAMDLFDRASQAKNR